MIFRQPQTHLLPGAAPVSFEPIADNLFGTILVRLPDSTLAQLSVESSGALSKPMQIDQNGQPTAVSAAGDHIALAYTRPSDSAVSLRAISLAGASKTLGAITIPYLLRNSGLPTRLFADTSSGLKFVGVFEDGSFAYYDEAGELWRRDESLADPADAIFVEFAEEKLLVESVERGWFFQTAIPGAIQASHTNFRFYQTKTGQH